MSRAVPAAQRKVAIDLVRKGATYKEAGRATGHADRTVRIWCRAAGVKSVPKKMTSNYVRFEDRPAVIGFLDQGHTVTETATRYRYTIHAIREAERIESRRRAKLAASRARTDARIRPPDQVVTQIRAFWDEGREEIAPGFIRRLHNRRELYAQFDAYDPGALDRIVRGGR